MRLIDVDPMREEVLYNWHNEREYDASAVLDLIDEQPTTHWMPMPKHPERR